MKAAANFYSAISSFTKYGFKVIQMVRRREPKATYSMRFLATCFGHNVPASLCANQIVRDYQKEQIEKRNSKTTCKTSSDSKKRSVVLTQKKASGKTAKKGTVAKRSR